MIYATSRRRMKQRRSSIPLIVHLPTSLYPLILSWSSTISSCDASKRFLSKERTISRSTVVRQRSIMKDKKREPNLFSFPFMRHRSSVDHALTFAIWRSLSSSSVKLLMSFSIRHFTYDFIWWLSGIIVLDEHG